LLERALAEMSKLPEEEQDAIATWLLDELASDRDWAGAFARSGVLLEQLAYEALVELRDGRTKLLNPDDL